MPKHNKWKAWTGASMLAVALFGSGCAQSVGDIDRTKPNKLKKSHFGEEKEYYFRQTVTNTDTQGSMIFEGNQSNLKRIKFVITERTLLACTTVQPVEGEFVESLNDERCIGAVAAFPITSHFDVQRSYSSGTGEQTNVIVENGSDRNWYEREYMRVDWSTNLVDGTGMFHGVLGQFSSQKYAVPQNDSYLDPDRARIRPDEGYLESTTAYTFRPDLYACLDSFGDGFWNCEGGQVRVKNSFYEVPKEKTFEPFIHLDLKPITKDGTDLGDPIMVTRVQDSKGVTEVECDDYTREKLLKDDGVYAEGRCQPKNFDYFGRFGFFRTENARFDEKRGVPDWNRRYYANHWNIWKTAYDEKGALLDYSARIPKPIVYHLNAEYPRDMVAPAQVVAEQWDKVFKETVRLAMGLDTIKEVEDKLAAEYDGDTRMYKIVSNSCMPDQVLAWKGKHGKIASADRSDPNDIFTKYFAMGTGSSDLDKLWSLKIRDRVQLCAELEFATENRKKRADRFDWERAGDVRYSFFYWVEEFNNYWSGYGPSSADPTTGEIISGTAHMAGSSLRMTAAYATDLVQYMNGELSDQNIVFGKQVRKYLKDARKNSAETMSQSLSPSGKRKMIMRAGLRPSDVSKSQFTKRPLLKDLPKVMLDRGPRYVKKQANLAAQAAMEAKLQDTRYLDFMSRSDVRALLLADPQAMLTAKAMASQNRAFSGKKLSATFDPEELELAYKQMVAPEIMYHRSKRFNERMSEQNILTTQSMHQAVETLVTYQGVAEYFKGKSRAEIERYFLEKMFVGTQLHEVGHTLGLRHNFNSSLDALNYHDEWWKIQELVTKGELDAKDTSKITDPAILAKLTKKEGVKYINETELRLGSVMDYTGDLTGRFAGVGKYDQAAINFVYAQKIQVWKDDVKLPNAWGTELFIADYTELPELFSGLPATADKKERRLAGIKNILEGRKWISIQEAQETIRGNIKTNTSNWKGGWSSDSEPIENRLVPYNFCSDERRGWVLGCSVFDWGSNQREIVNHAFNTYRYMQTFWRNKRHNVNKFGQNLNSYVGRLYRTFSMIERPFLYYSLYQNSDYGGFTDSLREAAIDAANFYSEVISTPEPGRYCLSGQDSEGTRVNKWWYYNIENTYVPSTWDNDGSSCNDYVDIQPGVGHYYNYDISDEYYYRVNYVGTFIDKTIAVGSMFNVSSNFLFNSFQTDNRATNNSYWTIFQDEMLTMLRGLILNDYTGFGGVYDKKAQAYQAPVMVDRGKFSHGLPAAQDNQPRIYTRLSFNHEFNALVFGLITNSTYADRNTDFAQYVKIAVDNNEIQDWGDAVTHRYVHPITNQIYIAPQTTDGKSLTVEMIQWANRLKVRWEDSSQDFKTKETTYQTLRTNFSGNFNPDDCLDSAIVNADADFKGVCEAMTAYEVARTSMDTRRRQMEDVTAKLDGIRFIFAALGPNALR